LRLLKRLVNILARCFIFGTFVDTNEVRSLAPIEVVILLEAPAYEAFAQYLNGKRGAHF